MITVTDFRKFRSTIFLVLFSFLPLFATVLTVCAQSRLEAGKAVVRQISGGESQEYAMTLAANQFLHLSVEQRGADVAVVLVAPDGKLLLEVDSPTGANGVEKVLFLTSAAGDYKVRLNSPEKTAKTGEYAIKIVELRLATVADEQQISAAKIVDAAFKLQEQRTAAGFVAAIEKYQAALKIYQAISDRAGEGLVRARIGQLYIFVGQFKAALEQNTAALALAREIGDNDLEATSLDNLGRSHLELTDTAKALEFYHRALNLRTARNQRAGTTATLNGIAAVYLKIGEYERSIEYNNRLLALYREIGNAYGEAVTISNLGSNYALLGEQQKAIELYLQALPFFRQSKIGFFEINILLNLGNSYRILGEQQKAIDFLNQALPLARSTGNRPVEANTLNNIAVFYRDLGDHQTALEYQTQALEIWRELKQTALVASALNNLGIIHRDLGSPEKALAYFAEALPLAREAKDRANESNILHNVAAISRLQNKYNDALANFNQALEIRRALNNPALQAETLGSIGSAHAALGDVPKALESYAQALTLVRSVNEPRVEAALLFGLASVQNDAQKFDEARKNVAAAIQLFESVRAKVINPSLRTSSLANVRDYYELRTNVLMNLHRAKSSERSNANFAALALESAENARARGLLELLNESRVNIRQGVKPELLDLERTTRQIIAAKANRQAQLLTDAKTTLAQKAAIEAELKQLTAAYDQIQAEIRLSSPRYAALTQPAPISLKEIQSQILDRDTVLLEYSLGEKQSFLWVVGQDSLEVYDLPARAQIETAAQRMYELLTRRNQSAATNSRFLQADKDLNDAAARLSELILPAQIVAQVGKKRLLIVADGALQYIPFAALTLSNSKNEFLIQRHEIVNLPSAATLIALRGEAKTAQVEPNSIAVIADPVFETSDARLAADANKQTSAPAAVVAKNDQASVVRRSAEESGVQGFSRLRFSRDEAAGIAKLTQPSQLLQTLDFAANKEFVMSGKLSKSKIVHFATHGLINSRNPELSGIVLSLVNERGELEDGFLRLYEIYNLPLDADLIVLSACQTALGKDIKGEGLVGLTRGFMYAGSRRVMASLWSVDDRATSQLMQRFYQKLLREKMRPAAALRAAQLEMSRTERFQNPYFWAAFTLQGEWR